MEDERAQDLIDRHREAWQSATKHPFLDGAREGSLSQNAFETWLVQDYLFVTDGLAFQSHIVARAPRRDQGLLINGLAALEAELGWFEEQAGRWNLKLDTSRHSTTEAYRDFLNSLEPDAYPTKITALWALERVYLESWRNAAPGHPDYREFVEHWTTPEFAVYVAGLGEAADDALEAADESERERAEAAFVEIVRLEREFWEMAIEEEGG